METTYVPIQEDNMKTYTFKIVIEPDEEGWFASCPVLESKGAATWGKTKEEALQYIEEVVRVVVESMREHGEALPEESQPGVEISSDLRVTVTV
jgi:predicted RNase H-like HicB family nuclease